MALKQTICYIVDVQQEMSDLSGKIDRLSSKNEAILQLVIELGKQYKEMQCIFSFTLLLSTRLSVFTQYRSVKNVEYAYVPKVIVTLPNWNMNRH